MEQESWAAAQLPLAHLTRPKTRLRQKVKFEILIKFQILLGHICGLLFIIITLASKNFFSEISNMAEVTSTLTQLVNAFKIHHKNASSDKEEFSHLLLLFYAAECGLKAKYLKQFNGHSTRDFETLPSLKKQGKYGHGHDLWRWVTELRIPQSGFTNHHEKPIVQMHERLRYGTYTRGAFEQTQIKFLKDITAILKKEL